jgi:hypothetical protein
MVSHVTSGLVLAVALLLIVAALGLGMLVVAAAAALYWVRRSQAEEPAALPDPRDPPAAGSADGTGSRPAPEPAGRAPRQTPAGAQRRKSQPPPPPPAPPPPESAAAASRPMLGFFDDETSTGAQIGPSRPSAGLGGGLMGVPPGGLLPSEARKGPMAPEDDESEEGATEIFSAGQVSAEFAALLEEPDEGTPSPAARRK